MTWSTRTGSSPARSSAARAAAVPRSAAESEARAPPNLPIGVRTGAARTMSSSCFAIGSIAPELGLALADVGFEPLAGVRALEELLLELALDGEAALERHLGAGLHGPLDPADRLGCLVRRAELAGVLVDLPGEVVALEDVVDDADPLRLLEVDQAAGDHQLDRRALADAAGEALGAAGAGEHAEVDLGQADLAGALFGDQDVRRHGDLEAAAHGVAFEGRDDQLGRLLQAVQRLVGVQAEVVFEVGIGGLQHVDVGAGAEELVAFA